MIEQTEKILLTMPEVIYLVGNDDFRSLSTKYPQRVFREFKELSTGNATGHYLVTDYSLNHEQWNFLRKKCLFKQQIDLNEQESLLINVCHYPIKPLKTEDIQPVSAITSGVDLMNLLSPKTIGLIPNNPITKALISESRNTQMVAFDNYDKSALVPDRENIRHVDRFLITSSINHNILRQQLLTLGVKENKILSVFHAQEAMSHFHFVNKSENEEEPEKTSTGPDNVNSFLKKNLIYLAKVYSDTQLIFFTDFYDENLPSNVKVQNDLSILLEEVGKWKHFALISEERYEEPAIKASLSSIMEKLIRVPVSFDIECLIDEITSRLEIFNDIILTSYVGHPKTRYFQVLIAFLIKLKLKGKVIGFVGVLISRLKFVDGLDVFHVDEPIERKADCIVNILSLFSDSITQLDYLIVGGHLNGYKRTITNSSSGGSNSLPSPMDGNNFPDHESLTTLDLQHYRTGSEVTEIIFSPFEAQVPFIKLKMAVQPVAFFSTGFAGAGRLIPAMAVFANECKRNRIVVERNHRSFLLPHEYLDAFLITANFNDFFDIHFHLLNREMIKIVQKNTNMKFIVLIRDPRDMLTSLILRRLKVSFDPGMTLHDTFTQIGARLYPFFEAASTLYGMKLSNVYFLRFENVHSDPMSEYKHVIDWLGWDYFNLMEESSYKKAILAGDFDTQKKNPDLSDVIVSTHRKGVSGDWVNHWTPEMKSYFRERGGDRFLLDLEYENTPNW